MSESRKVVPIGGGLVARDLLVDLAESLPVDAGVLVIWREPGGGLYSSAGAGIGQKEALWMLEETKHDLMTQTQCCRCDMEGE